MFFFSIVYYNLFNFCNDVLSGGLFNLCVCFCGFFDNDDWKNIDVIMILFLENFFICYLIFKDRKNKEVFGFWVKFFFFFEGLIDIKNFFGFFLEVVEKFWIVKRI